MMDDDDDDALAIDYDPSVRDATAGVSFSGENGQTVSLRQDTISLSQARRLTLKSVRHNQA